jgi:hypothetical protein
MGPIKFMRPNTGSLPQTSIGLDAGCELDTRVSFPKQQHTLDDRPLSEFDHTSYWSGLHRLKNDVFIVLMSSLSATSRGKRQVSGCKAAIENPHGRNPWVETPSVWAL